MCHVLIIEDDPLIACDLGDIAVEAGATSVAFASSPGEALTSALLKPPAVLFSDVQIIDGTGPGAVTAIRDHLATTVPVIFVTATPDACGGFADAIVLVKPVLRATLVEAFRSTQLV